MLKSLKIWGMAVGLGLISVAGISAAKTPISRAEDQAAIIQDNTFYPETVTIAAGETVYWTNLDADYHTVTGEAFDTGAFGQNVTQSVTFVDPGVYTYWCQLHANMTGWVIVE